MLNFLLQSRIFIIIIITCITYGNNNTSLTLVKHNSLPLKCGVDRVGKQISIILINRQTMSHFSSAH